jgi:hypothetical protein
MGGKLGGERMGGKFPEKKCFFRDEAAERIGPRFLSG